MLPIDGCSRADSLALRKPHVPTNLLLGLAVRVVQRLLQLILVRGIALRAQIGQNREITVDFFNGHLRVIRLLDSQRLTVSPVGRQRLERSDLTTYWNAAGTQSRPAEPGQQPVARLAWEEATLTAKRRQPDQTLCDGPHSLLELPKV